MKFLLTFKKPPEEKLTLPLQKKYASQKKYGFYSPESDKRFGHLIWSTPTGEHVKVTEVTSDPNATSYHWEDKINMGEVVSYVSGNTIFHTLIWKDTNYEIG